MGIIDVRNALQESAGSEFTIKDVNLYYASGGKKQMIRFFVRHNKPGTSFKERIALIAIEGNANPTTEAARIGAQLAEEVNGE